MTLLCQFVVRNSRKVKVKPKHVPLNLQLPLLSSSLSLSSSFSSFSPHSSILWSDDCSSRTTTVSTNTATSTLLPNNCYHQSLGMPVSTFIGKNQGTSYRYMSTTTTGNDHANNNDDDDDDITTTTSATNNPTTLLEKIQSKQKEGQLKVSILGPSNAGKSTLFNRLMCKESNKAYRLSSEKSLRRPNRSKVRWLLFLFFV